MTDLFFASTDAPLLQIADDAGRELLRLKVVDGRLTAHYDPADLDEAARVFCDNLVRVLPRVE